MEHGNHNHNQDHSGHGDHHDHGGHKKSGNISMAVQATLHCLMGCGIGEVAGIIIGRLLGLDTVTTMILAVSLGFVFGLALGIRPLLKGKIGFSKSLKIVLASEGLSILVMESAEVLTEIYTPGVMAAGLDEGIFWLGMLLALSAGFLAAFPVNVYLIGKGVRHCH